MPPRKFWDCKIAEKIQLNFAKSLISGVKTLPVVLSACAMRCRVPALQIFNQRFFLYKILYCEVCNDTLCHRFWRSSMNHDDVNVKNINADQS